MACQACWSETRYTISYFHATVAHESGRECWRRVSYELIDRKIKQRENTYQSLLAIKRKSHLYRIVKNNLKWIFLKILDARYYRLISADRHHDSQDEIATDRWVMLWILWDEQDIVYHNILKRGKAIPDQHRRQEIVKLHSSMLRKSRFLRRSTISWFFLMNTNHRIHLFRPRTTWHNSSRRY